MRRHDEVASPSLPAQLLQHVTRRRHRPYGAVGVALILLAVGIWVYGGLATRIDFTTPSTHLPGRLPLPNEYQRSHSTQSPAAEVVRGIPHKIWQILLPKKASDGKATIKPEVLEDTPSWLAMNPDYTYTLVGQKGAEEFVQKHFASDLRIIEAYNKMPNVGMKSDLLRYLILEVEGGVYTDTDTVALKPVDQWVPDKIRDKVAVVVGIEFDRRDDGPWEDIAYWVQFCQWTIAAAPGHPVFRKMAARILASLNDLSVKHGVSVERLKPTGFDVMNSTGPAAWTDVVFRQLQEYDPSLTDIKDLSFMTEPTLYGNILVLTIDGFGMGQAHSNSTNDGTIPEAALVKHLFKGGWRRD